jgi:hypothetical protein
MDSYENIYLTGFTKSSNFPTIASLQAVNSGGWDAFATKINAYNSEMIFSTYLGGVSDEGFLPSGFLLDKKCGGIAVDTMANIYITGYTSSHDFPTEKSYQPVIAGESDAFITKINILSPDTRHPVYRFWSDIFHSHHYTISLWERDYILDYWPDAWAYEGIAFYAYAGGQGGTLPVFRFWSELFRSHHYTISEWERDYIIATWPEVWTYEGIAFYGYVSPQPGALPVYRFWSEMYHSHHYTISEWERDYIINTWPEAWTYEGIAFYMYVAP